MSAAHKYRPSNGTDGDAFISAWCVKCERDSSMNGKKNLEECEESELCQIVNMVMALGHDDPNYPSEWCFDDNGHPCCTAFIALGDPIPQPRCLFTIDMFQE